ISGAGLIMVESTAVSEMGRISQRDLVLETDKQEEGFRRTRERLRTLSSTPVVVQLSHAGRKGSVHAPWIRSGRNLGAGGGAWTTLSASAIPRANGWQVPEEMTVDQVKGVIGEFRQASQRAIAAGFDGVEIHMAHGYLLHQFLSPISNHRSDGFGGDLEQRCRFPLEVVKSVRKIIPQSHILGVRMTGDDWLDGGWSTENAIYLAKALQNLGVDYLCVSSGGIVPVTKLRFNSGYQVHLARHVKGAVSIPVRTSGMITNPGQADSIVRDGSADMIAIGRQFIRDPWFAYQAADCLGASMSVPSQYLRCLP
ncbi:MAG: tRNA-dihydrouridine synthase, partial [Betaproteobacteria bacterium]